jgi:hypothetical protein
MRTLLNACAVTLVQAALPGSRDMISTQFLVILANAHCCPQ